jgi:hypothetical protein
MLNNNYNWFINSKNDRCKRHKVFPLLVCFNNASPIFIAGPSRHN